MARRPAAIGPQEAPEMSEHRGNGDRLSSIGGGGHPGEGGRRATIGLSQLPGSKDFELVHPRCVLQRRGDYEDGMELWKAGDPEGARDALRFALEGCGDNLWIHVALGRIALEADEDFDGVGSPDELLRSGLAAPPSRASEAPSPSPEHACCARQKPVKNVSDAKPKVVRMSSLQPESSRRSSPRHKRQYTPGKRTQGVFFL